MTASLNTSAGVMQQIRRASQRLNAECPECALAALCSDHPGVEPDLIHYRQGEKLYRHGDSDGYLYSVRSGCVKLNRHRVVGEEQVLGFYFCGDIFGFDGLASTRRTTEATALQDCSVCRLSVQELLARGHGTPSLQQLLKLAGHAALTYQEHAALVNRRQATTRLAAFVLDIISRGNRCRHNDLEISLPMSRLEIASYLGLTVETVSRRLCDLDREQLIAIDDKRRSLRITNLEGLQQLAHY